MGKEGRSARQIATLITAISCIALSTIGGADSVQRGRGNIADRELFFGPVPKAVCGPGDTPETALQGQVPASMRAAGFQGFSCNLQRIGQVRDEGANWQTTQRVEGRGKNRKICGYHGTAHPTAAPHPTAPPRTNYGVRVVDLTDAANPHITAYLTTTAMLDPWESLKVNERRALLGAVNAANGNAPAGIDIYDVSGDCRYPQLLSSTFIAEGQNGGIPFPGLAGHEGSWAPDGMTYYGRGGRNYYAIDTTNTLAPKLIAVFNPPLSISSGHGLSVSEDGTRGYFVASAQVTGQNLTDPNFPAGNGLIIYDLTEIQERRENPQVGVVGELYWKDGGVAQMTIPVKIGRKPYVIHADEAGTGGFHTPAQFAQACALGMIAFPYVRIIDISDERNPRVVSKIFHEVHLPANCEAVAPDLPGTGNFNYGSHYCSVDNKRRATTLACGFFNSGIRIFDIRDPIRPREIAYYNPPGMTTVSPGSQHTTANRGWMPGHPDLCSAQVHLDAERGTVWSTCQSNGVLSLKFTHNAWPFAESTTPPGMQN